MTAVDKTTHLRVMTWNLELVARLFVDHYELAHLQDVVRAHRS